MGNYKKIIAFLLSIVLLAGVLFACSSRQKAADQVASPEVQRERFSMLAQNRVVEEVPGITKATTLETEGTALISADCPQVENNENISAALSSYVQEKLNQFKSEVATMGEDTQTERLYFFDLTYKPYEIGTELLGIKFTQSSFTGKTDTPSHIDAFVYHLGTGEQIGLEDVFDNAQDYLPLLAGTAREYLSRNALLQNPDEALFEQGTSPSLQNYSNFVITPGQKIIFYFNQGTIAPIDAGSLEVSIPMSELEHILNPQNKEMLLGTGKSQVLGTEGEDPTDLDAPDATTLESPQEVIDLFPSGDNYMLPHTLDGIDINGKIVALTMDDGPSKSTPEVLDILKEEDVKATFFIIGENISGREDTIKREYDEGHELGTHTWKHEYLSDIGLDAALDTIGRTNDAIEEITGKRTIIDRPPGGKMNAELAAELKRPQIMWSADTMDWDYRRKLDESDAIAESVKKAMNEMRDGGVILWHDLHSTAPGILRSLISELKAQDYQFVTITQLMQIAKLRGADVGYYFTSAPTAQEAPSGDTEDGDSETTDDDTESPDTESPDNEDTDEA